MKLLYSLRNFFGKKPENPIRQFFNEQFYLTRYADVKKSGGAAWDHYVAFGMRESRQPRADFNPNYYRQMHSAEVGSEEPFRHWIAVGRAKGYRGHPWIDDPDVDAIAAMRALFDSGFYLANSPDVAAASVDPFEHFLEFGWKEGRNPAPWFRFDDYLQMNPELRTANDNPFSHYALVGRPAGLLPAFEAPLSGSNDIDPFVYDMVGAEFDIDFYRTQFPDSQGVPADCVAHYIRQGAADGLDPNNWFSTRGYLTNNEDVLKSGINPLFHFVCQGRAEKRSYKLGAPEPILRAVPDQAALGAAAATNATEAYFQHLAFTSPGPDFEEPDNSILRSRVPRAKLIAYYLPQFHVIPENDAWWGQGFTEWRNVIRGQPRYRGHRQPRVPERLGFYDLSNGETLKKQVALARMAGVYGFCFYYYNFNGRRILEKPVEAFLADKSVDYPFCLMWANENWTRTWDGLDRSVLLKQDYQIADEPALLADFARHFDDPRYIRIAGRPLLFIYRPGQVPNAKQRFAEWRVVWEKDHNVRPLFFMAQGFDDIDPTTYGLDGAIEFPPHKICKDMKPLNPELELFDPSFAGHVVSYAETVDRSLEEAAPNFPLIKTAVPSWDNEARRPGRGMTLHGATPDRYERWLRKLVDFAEKNPVFGEPFVGVNAWNEWAEGAYLEPDAYHGAAYLNATARALAGAPTRTNLARHPILIVGHDAYAHGAQLLVRNLAVLFRNHFGFDVHLAICGDGPMLEEYRTIANSCSTINRRDVNDGINFAQRMAEQGVTRAIVNTTVSGWMVPILKASGFTVTSLIHELSQLIGEYGLEQEAVAIAKSADNIVFPAELVRDSFLSVSGAVGCDVLVQPQGLYREDIRAVARSQRNTLRAAIGIPPNAKVVINVGFADMRKGFDIFLKVARAMCAKQPEAYFIWVGAGTPDAERWQMADVASSGLTERIRLTGYTEHVADYFAMADAFFLTSREDPFPSVVLESLAAGLPIVAVRGTCGTNDIVETYGQLVDINDEHVQIRALQVAFKATAAQRDAMQQMVRGKYQFDEYGFTVVRTVYPELPKISVVVPNYNYARYMDSRLNSIFRQTHPVFEIIVLDDVSTDNSLEVIATIASDAGRRIKIVTNESNSGSVFKQWRKGVEQARGDFVWIAEADDDCEETFLQTILARMTRDNAAFGFTDSWQVGSHGERLGDSYRPYLAEETPGTFEASFSADGKTFARDYLSIKNVILNVSGAVFRREALIAAMDAVGDDILRYRVAGDWRLYVELCAQPGAMVAYEAKALNGHRRHPISVTHSINNEKHFAEIQDVQAHAEALAGRLPDAVKTTRQLYLDKVKTYLGL